MQKSAKSICFSFFCDYPKIPYERRYCIACPNHNLEIECETHYLFSCTAYSDLRQTWLTSLEKPDNFDSLEIGQKLDVGLNVTSNIKLKANFILGATFLSSTK